MKKIKKKIVLWDWEREG